MHRTFLHSNTVMLHGRSVIAYYSFDAVVQLKPPTGVHHIPLSKLPILLVAPLLHLNTSTKTQGRSIDIESHYTRPNTRFFFRLRLMCHIAWKRSMLQVINQCLQDYVDLLEKFIFKWCDYLFTKDLYGHVFFCPSSKVTARFTSMLAI